MKTRMITALFCATALSLTAPAVAQEAPTSQAELTQSSLEAAFGIADTDLPIDPDYRLGVLDNGMRYIIRPNGTPEGQGMVYLWVNAGSLGEEADQAGFAHYVEHMAFNGSTNIPEGEMVALLEREGLAFGADTNASTTFHRTLYTLNLPRNDADLLGTALMIMRETASELSFNEGAVEREMGVVQSELRVRDTYSQRNTMDQLKFLYPGSNFGENWIGGSLESIGSATSQRLRDYYDRWYRPDNVAVIVVGDFDADAVEAEITEHFASWQAPGVEPASLAGPFEIGLAGQTDIFVDPALPDQIQVSRHGEWIAQPDNSETRQQRVLTQLGYGIISRRFQRLSRDANPPFRAAGLITEELFKEARSSGLIVQAVDGDWQGGLAAAQEEYRRAMEFGFSEAEVAEQVANLRAAIESNAAGEATRNNGNFITGAITLIEDGQVPTTPASAKQRFEAMVGSITPAAIVEAVRTDFVPLDNPLIRFSGRNAPEGGEAALRAAWDNGMQVPLQQREQAAAAEFAYTDFGTPGTITSYLVEEQLGIHQITFANGLKLNLKRTDLQEDRVSVQLNIDGGQMLDTEDDPLATALTSSLPVGGLGAHTLDELQSALAGKQVGINISPNDETFVVSATTTPGDLELQLRLIAAAITDPAYRPDGEAQYHQTVSNFFARYTATPGSTLNNALGIIISDNNPRFSLQSEEQYMELSFAKLRDAISDRLQNGAMEMALVGDFDESEAITFVASTLGALPARETEFSDWEDQRTRSFTAQREPRALYHDGEDNQALLHMVWPTRDGEDFGEAVQLEMMQDVVRLRLVEILREELGQTYSPSASASQSRVFRDWGTFSVGASITPEDVDATRDAMLAVIGELRDAPPSADLMQRARAPQLENLDNMLKTNGSWMGLVDRAQTQPDRLERYANAREAMMGVTARDVQQMALRYLDPDARLEVTVLPRPDEE